MKPRDFLFYGRRHGGKRTGLIFGCFFLLAALFTATAQAVQPGESLFGRENYIEYRVGNLPVILTSSHGGHLTPDEIADRTWGVTGRDTNTRELTLAMAQEIFQRTGKHPHVIISHLRRIKLDPNREIVEAAQGDPYAEQAWHEFHGFIQTAREIAEAEFGFGFLFDIHGHAHEIQRLELGYALGNSVLNLSDTQLEEPGYGWSSSLRTLKLLRPGVPFPELLRGPRSLGQLFNDRGVPSWPSEDYPSPGSAPFFSGGYITRQHSCLIDNGPINGVQIECHFGGIRDTAANRAAFAQNFARVLQPYLWDNYGYSVGTLSLYRLGSATAELRKGGPLAVVNVLREGYSAYSATVALEFGGTAVRGVDYTVSSTSVSFSSNQQSGQVVIFPAGPNADLGDKTIEIRLAPTYRQSADPRPVLFTLADGISQTVRVRAKESEVCESSREAAWILTRTESTGSLDVFLEWDGSAVPGRDYSFPDDLPTNATFPSGVLEIGLKVPVIDDALSAPDREIVLRVLPGPGYLVGHAGEAGVLVRDDDSPAGIKVWLREDVADNRLLDVSGGGNHATTLPAGRGPAQLDAAEGFGFSFNGIDDTAALPKLDTGELHQFTLAFFLRPRPGTGERNLLSFGGLGASGSLNIYLTSSTNVRTWLVPAGGLSSSSALDVTDFFVTGEWVHYALTVNEQGIARVYVNGNLRRESGGWVAPLNPDELFWLGWRRQGGGSGGYYAGHLRDFRLYGRALSAEEVGAVAAGHQTFTSWKSERGVPAGATLLEDFDGDGHPLLLEYAMGAAPTLPGLLPQYRGRMEDGRATLTFLHQAAASDVTWTVEGGALSGEGWETVAQKGPGQTAWTLAPGALLTENNDLVTVVDPVPVAERDRRFLRVRVDHSP